jgi:hypothetical protein
MNGIIIIIGIAKEQIEMINLIMIKYLEIRNPAAYD